MIWKEIELEISKKDLEHLKVLNREVLDHLDKQQSLQVKTWQDLLAALSGVVTKDKELCELLKEIHDSADHYVLRLVHGDNEILNLPWAGAIDPASGKSLGDITGLHLARSIPGKFKQMIPGEANNAPPLKILVMISSPEDTEWNKVLSYDEEEWAILQAFEPLLQQGLVEIDFTGDGSLEALEEKLKAHHYHVLHFSGHGVFQEGIGYLQLEDALTLKSIHTPAEDFADVLNKKPAHRPSLVMLSSCQSSRGETEAGLRGVTNQLLRKGVPAVIAMGMSIADSYAAQFAAHFYKQLAEKEHIFRAFKEARNFIKDLEYNSLVAERNEPAIPLQWHIPALYISTKLEMPVDWTMAHKKLDLGKTGKLKDKGAFLFNKEEKELFLGRRKDKAKVLKPFFDKTPLLLKGQGGVGKTALAIHLLHRLQARHPGTIPFVFDETTGGLEEINKRLKSFLVNRGDIDNYVKADTYDKAMERFLFLVIMVSNHCQPVFLFDNLEDFQQGPGLAFKPEHQDILAAIKFLVDNGGYHVLLTCRYPLAEFPNILSFDLNQVGLNDFWKRCLYMDLGGIRAKLKERQKENKDPLLLPNKLKFIDVVKLLHRTFGGNHRALEFFNGLVTQNPTKLKEALESLEIFQEKYQKETLETRDRLGKNLVFDQLIGLMEPQQWHILSLLSHYRVPVLGFALELQPAMDIAGTILGDTLADLQDLTLAEITLDRQTDSLYYYVTPIVKDLLSQKKDSASAPAFSHHQAGIYHQHHYHNLEGDIADLEEAFHHHYLAKDTDQVAHLGDKLTSFFYDIFLFDNAQFYGLRSEALLGPHTPADILNRLGLITKLYGDLNKALEYYDSALKKFRAEKNRKSEGATLVNIGNIYYAQGDYEKALDYLEKCLKIFEELGDKQHVGGTLNNISQIYAACGDVDKALEYLEQSLKIRQEIGDKSGEGTTLGNIGTIYYNQGKVKKALENFKKSLEIFREVGNKSQEGTTLNNISQIYKARGDVDTALDYLEKSLKIRQEIGDKSGAGATLNNIAGIFRARGDYDKALEYLEKCLKIFEELGDKKQYGVILNNISQIYDAHGDYDKALDYLELSLKISQEIGDKSGEAYTLFNLASTCLDDKVNRPDEGMAYLAQVIEINKTLKNARITAALQDFLGDQEEGG